MLEIVLARPGEFISGGAPEPPPAAGGRRARTRRIGVCGPDLHAFAGRQPFLSYPRILGHELGVEVLEIAPAVDAASDEQARTLKSGDRCAIEPYFTCGTCRACRIGRYNCCEQL